MAKKQTFGDKVKKQQEQQKPVVKVIKGIRNANGSTKFVEELVQVDDLKEVTKIDIK